MSNKAASLTGALLSGKDAGARSPDAPPAAAEVVRYVALPLDAARHRRLRLAAAHLDQTQETLMVAALDHYLDRVVAALLDGRCACLEEGRGSAQGCIAASFASAKSEGTQ